MSVLAQDTDDDGLYCARCDAFVPMPYRWIRLFGPERERERVWCSTCAAEEALRRILNQRIAAHKALVAVTDWKCDYDCPAPANCRSLCWLGEDPGPLNPKPPKRKRPRRDAPSDTQQDLFS